MQTLEQNDIQIEEINNNSTPNRINNTPTFDEYDQTPKYTTPSWYKNKRNLIIIGVSTLLLIVIIAVAVACSGKNNKTPTIEKPLIDTSRLDISYKVNEVLKYSDETTQTTTVTFSGVGSQSQNTIIKGDYLFNVYEVNESTTPKEYKAIAVLLNLKKIRGGKENDIGGEDITKLTSANNKLPLIKFTFNADGIVKETSIPNELSKTIAAYVYEFIEKIVFEVTSKTRRLDDAKREIQIEGESVSMTITSQEGKFGENEDSKENKKTKVNVKDGKIQKVDSTKNAVINANNLQQIDFVLNSNFSDETEAEVLSNKKNLIENINQKFESKMTLNSENENEELTNKIQNLLSKVNFVKYNPLTSADKRILGAFSIKQFNELSNEEQTRQLQTTINDFYYQPLFFDYPLFRTNLFGAKIGIIARISFSPQNGLFTSKVFLHLENNQILLFEKETYTNFGEIIDKIDEILQRAAFYITEDVEKKIQVEYDSIKDRINDELNNLHAVMERFPGFINIFHEPLEQLLNDIYEASANCYNAVYLRSEKTVTKYNELYDDIKNNNENSYLQYILGESETTINDFIQDIIDQLNKIYTASQNFFPSIKSDVQHQLDLIKDRYDTNFTQFDICTYYDIEDKLNEIKNIFNNFESGVKNATIMENAFFNSSIMSSFESMVDPYIKHIEYYSEKMKNNISVIEGMRRYYGQEVGDSRRESTINWIDGMRRKIYNMMDEILGKVNKFYEKKILSLNNDFQGVIDTFKNQIQEISKNGTELIEYLKENKLVNYAQNFSIYVEDIKSISTIYISTLQVRQKAFKTYIIDALTKVDDDYITPRIELFKKDLEISFYKIIDETKLKHYSTAIELCENLLANVPQLVKRYLNLDLASKIKEKYVNDDLFNKMVNDYYGEVLPAFMEFNNTFFEKTFKSHMSDYISRPTEVETKLRKIQNNEELILNETIETITTIIITYINDEIKDAYLRASNSFANYIDIFHIQAPKGTYGNSGNYRKLYEDIEEYLNKIQSQLDESIKSIPILYMRKKKDEFSITKYFKPKEFEITNNILGKLIDEIYIYFDEYICITNEVICEDGKIKDIMSAIEHFQFQLAKLRSAVSYLTTLIPYAKDIINSDLLAELDPLEFLNLYINNFNYNENSLINQILELLDYINTETKTFISNYASGIKDKIKEIFYNAINKDGLAAEVTKIAESIFIDPLEYQERLKSFVEGPCGPIARIMVLFNEEIIYNDEKSIMKFSFDRAAYEKDFQNVRDELRQYYHDEREKFLDELFVPADLEQKLYDHIDKLIDDIYDEINEQLNLICNNTELIFLNSTFTLLDIIKGSLEDISKKIKDEIKEEIENIYNEYLDKLIEIVKTNLDRRYDVILEHLNSQYDSTYNVYSNKSQASSYVINALDRESLVPGLKLNFENFINKAKEIYNQITIETSLNELQDVELENFIMLTGEVGVIGDIKDTFSDFIKKAELRFTQEVLRFKANIEVYFVKGFNQTINNFLKNAGKDYLDAIIQSDNMTNVLSKFTNMMIYVNDTYEYMNALLDDVYLKQISKLISKRVEEIYGFVRDEIKEVIENQIETIISNKFENFKNAVLGLIPNYFLTRLKEIIESEYFKNTLYNEKVYNLIPKEFTDGFRANLTQYLHESLTTEKLKNQYKETVNSDFQKVINILTDYHIKIGKRVSEASHTYSNAAMNSMIQRYMDWSEDVNDFDVLYSLEVSESKKDKVKELYENEIIPSLISIIEGYDIERGTQIRNLERVLDNYRVTDFLKEVKALLENLQFESNIEEIKIKIEEIMNDLYNKFKEMFDNIGNKLKEEFKDPASGFKKRTVERRNLRNLLKYDLRQIKEQLYITHQRYDRFKDILLKNENLIAVAARVGAFKGQVLNSAESLSEFIDAYELLISDFIDPSRVTDVIQSKASQVKAFLVEYTMDISKDVYDAISVIKIRIRQGWVDIKKTIDESITNALDAVFKVLFSDLTKFIESKKETMNQNKEYEYYIFDEKDQVLAKVDLLVKSVDLAYTFSIEKYNDFYFLSRISTNATLNGQVSITVEDSMKLSENGTIGGGTIGMDIAYILDDKHVEVVSSIKTNSAKYLKVYQEFDFNTLNWVTLQSFSEGSRINTDIKFTKIFQNGFGRLSSYYAGR